MYICIQELVWQASSLAKLGTPFTDWQKERILITTAGKAIFNEILPADFPFLTSLHKKT